MPRTTLPEPDPETLTVRLSDGTIVLVAHLDPDLPDDHSPLRRALRAASLLTGRNVN
ncbi:hypothetical protein [Streptomyces lateritius]|uniref:hypothetical protein n=1 Tax=Streptomyces lateritius TaxID=67313 RepID=UPI00167678E8|nr:hypothetical protein [Streptomyces lateritius]GGU12578.1 hypothetical protein GCM10010272_67170 [Streptomyces lateritius]